MRAMRCTVFAGHGRYCIVSVDELIYSGSDSVVIEALFCVVCRDRPDVRLFAFHIHHSLGHHHR